MIDKILTDIIAEEVPDKEVAVFLSGGVDSLSLAFSVHRLGKKVHAYTFHLKDQPSYDSDKAIEVAKIFEWDIEVIEVPIDNLPNDFFTLLSKYQCKKKTHFECAFPFMYIYPKIKEKYVISGLGADGFCGLSKKVALHFKEPKVVFDNFRRENLMNKNYAGIQQHFLLCQEYNKILIHPYYKCMVDNTFVY